MLMKYPHLENINCITWMQKQKAKSISCVITSPPYNLDIKYSKYKDNMSRADYLNWFYQVSKEIKRILKDDGHFFLNVGSINSDPYVDIDVCNEVRKEFCLQNNFTWVKHIALHDKGYGQYKPITSKRYVSNTTESIFHFTKDGNVEVDRLAIGQRNKTHEKYPELYSENRHRAVARRKVSKKLGFSNYKSFMAGSSKEEKEKFEVLLKQTIKDNPYNPNKPKCIGNAWFIPYTPTSKLSKNIGAQKDHNYREVSRGNHPATFPLQLPMQCIKFSGIKKGSIVYDPFVGTGTTVLAATILGMKGVGNDVDNDYLDFARNRIMAETFEIQKELDLV
jgi:site-specific DNA-methyltransferase (adenine-specific)